MKAITALILNLSICLFSSSGLAWREVGNGGGLTEQNLIYLKENFSAVLRPLVDVDGNLMTVTEKTEILTFSTILKSNVSLFFENQQTTLKVPFVVKGDKWWIQTFYLNSYDIDSSNELNWSEAATLLYDVFVKSGLSILSVEQQNNLRFKLAEIFSAQFIHETVSFGNNNLLQTTALRNRDNEQTDFILQVNDSKPFSLTANLKTALGCNHKLQKLNVEYLGLRFSEEIEDSLIFVIGLKVHSSCNSTNSSERILLKLSAQNKKINIIDVGFQ